MATKKKSKTKVKRAKPVGKTKHRACSVCRKLGHNKRSHKPGAVRGLAGKAEK